jgi:UDP:flavonoid glycosyltransferase YjiC (YdhE family)
VAGRLPIAPTVYRAAIDALAGLPVRALVTTGRTRGVEGLGNLPPNVHAEPWVDQQAAFDAAALVVCHGGAGTAFGALAAGLPLVVVPLMADQPRNGRIIDGAGAGLVVSPDDPEAPAPLRVRLRAAIEEALGTSSYRGAAAGIAEEMRAMPSLQEVVDEL